MSIVDDIAKASERFADDAPIVACRMHPATIDRLVASHGRTTAEHARAIYGDVEIVPDVTLPRAAVEPMTRAELDAWRDFRVPWGTP